MNFLTVMGAAACAVGGGCDATSVDRRGNCCAGGHAKDDGKAGAQAGASN